MIYGALINFRNSLYKKGIIKSYALGIPAISVGNITVGGTGKTPLAAYLTEFLADAGEKVCILTRGYGREQPQQRIVVSDGKNIVKNPRLTGDEPLELANRLRDKAIIIADANRAAAGNWARENFDISVFILDDAFQHLRVRRDLNLVCIDAANPFGNKKVLPFGILREPLGNLKRAGAVVITRANLLQEGQIDKLKIEIRNITNAPIFVSRNKIRCLTELRSKTEYQKPEAALFAFCALGNPQNFFAQLKDENFNVIGEKTFSDHHFYGQNDIVKLERQAKDKNAEFLITTAKDAVKLKDLNFDLPCLVAENELVFDEEKKLRELLSAVLKKN